MKEDILAYSSTVMFRGTPCKFAVKTTVADDNINKVKTIFDFHFNLYQTV